MRKLTLLFAVVISTTALSFANAETIIGGSVGNGEQLTGTTLADNGMQVAANGTTQTSLTSGMVTNDNGRALITSTGNGVWIEVDGWRMTRTFQNGGNAAFGWDAGNLVGTEAAQYGFVNRGGVDFDSSVIGGVFNAGDQFDLSFFTEMTSGTGTADATLTFDNGEVFNFSTHNSSTTASQFSDSATLVGSATTVQVSIALLTDESVGAPQLKIDSINLERISAVPEPTSLAFLGLAGIAVGFRRRR